MKSILLRLCDRIDNLIDVQPLLALFLGAALLAVLLRVVFRPDPSADLESRSLLRTLYHRGLRLAWGLFLVGLLAGTMSLLRTYLHRTLADFQRSHGRITTANYNAVQTIWGAEQTQGELDVLLFHEEEVTERIEFEELAKPAAIRKKTVRHVHTSNPFISARHEVTLRQNPRRKGSALYGGYETACRFTWRLKNPADRQLTSVLTFPLPASDAMYDEISATLNGRDILPQMQLRDGSLILTRELKPNETMDLNLGFTSRGMSYWYFQVREPREIRDFTLTLNLPDLPVSKLNYPEGCMTPTNIKPMAGGSVLTYRLDHAISNKGMGISLPALPQPGAVTSAVLKEVETAWLLVFGMLVLGLSMASVKHAVLLSALFGTATSCAYGLLGDFSDLLFGFAGTALMVVVPSFLFLAWTLRRAVPGPGGLLLCWQLLLFGVLYPMLAGLDSDRQSLYFNLCAVVFLAAAARQLTHGPVGLAPEEKHAIAGVQLPVPKTEPA